MFEAHTPRLTLSRGNSKNDFQYMMIDPLLNALSNFRQEYVDVVVIFLPKHEKELIPNVRVLMKENNDIDLADLVKSLSFMGFPVERNMISYYSYTSDLFVYCGKDPLPEYTVLPGREIDIATGRSQITIRIRQGQFPSQNIPETPCYDAAEAKMEFEQEEEASTNPDINNDDQMSVTQNEGIESPVDSPSSNKHKRTKERKIGYIIDRVIEWRKLYNGYLDPETGRIVKLSLEDAAKKITISKKSLDDYLLQIRFGKKYGFDFEGHYNDRVGILRSFVKKFKGTAKADRELNQISTMPEELAKILEKKESKDKIRKETSFQPNIGLSTRSKKIKSSN